MSRVTSPTVEAVCAYWSRHTPGKQYVRDGTLERGSREFFARGRLACLEFFKRRVRVAATDLTPSAVELTAKHFAIKGVHAEDVRVENVLALSSTTTPSMPSGPQGCCTTREISGQAVREVYRVLKPAGAP